MQLNDEESDATIINVIKVVHRNGNHRGRGRRELYGLTENIRVPYVIVDSNLSATLEDMLVRGPIRIRNLRTDGRIQTGR